MTPADPSPHLGEPRWPNGLRPELPPLPANIAKLPRHRGYPVPYFVGWVNGEPEFRVADGAKFVSCIRHGLCWTCGRPIVGPSAFLIGPMCAVNRISSEPPSHIECAEWSVRGCPFLSRPHMERREGGMPEGSDNPAGIMIRRNPGVSLLWVTPRFRVIRAPGPRGYLIEVGSPKRLTAYVRGRVATPAEVREAFDAGVPALRSVAAEEGAPVLALLARQVTAAERLLGIAGVRAKEVSGA